MIPQLTRRLALENPVRVADAAGGFTTTWNVLGTHWADVRPAKGRAAEGEAGPLSRVPMVIVVRAYPVGSDARPVPGQRFTEGSRRFAILAVTEMEQGDRFLEIIAEEEIAA